MSDLNMQFVREFFELNLFHVLTHWQHEDLLTHIADPSTLLFVERNEPAETGKLDFVLRPVALPRLQKAVVDVRAWHGDRCYPSIIEGNPRLGRVAEKETASLAQSIFGSYDFTTILVISELPTTAVHCDRSVRLLEELGVGHILEFPAILQDMLSRIGAHGNYAPSQTLQTMRLLKRYNFIRRQQLEFTFSPEPPPVATPPTVDVATTPEKGTDHVSAQ